MTVQSGLQAMKLQDLKSKSPTDLLDFAEALEIETASSFRKLCWLQSLHLAAS